MAPGSAIDKGCRARTGRHRGFRRAGPGRRPRRDVARRQKSGRLLRHAVPRR